MTKQIKPEFIYLSFDQITACEKAVKEISRDMGILNDSIKIVNNGENHGSWLEVEPTEAKYLFQLGMKTYKIMQEINCPVS